MTFWKPTEDCLGRIYRDAAGTRFVVDLSSYSSEMPSLYCVSLAGMEPTDVPTRIGDHASPGRCFHPSWLRLPVVEEIKDISE